MTPKEMRESIKDLAFAIRRLGSWARRTAHPGPESEDLVLAIEKRLSAIAARLGVDD